VAQIAWLAFLATDNKKLIEADVRRWAELEQRDPDIHRTLVDLAAERTEFRTLLHHRLYWGNTAGNLLCHVLFIFLKPKVHLFLACRDIEGGLYLQHAYSTGIDAHHVGKNVWINQEVTIGSNVVAGQVGKPVIEDGVTIYAGAKVVGDVRIGRNAVIGANAVVVRDVPDDMIAVGVPATIRPKGRIAKTNDEDDG
jgi:serine O-acetyltransferase